MAANLILTDKMTVKDYEGIYQYIEKYGLDELISLKEQLEQGQKGKRLIRQLIRGEETSINMDPQLFYQLTWYLKYFIAKTEKENQNGKISADKYLESLEKLRTLGIQDIRLCHGNDIKFKNPDWFYLGEDFTTKLYSNVPITYSSNEDPDKLPFHADLYTTNPSWKIESFIERNGNPSIILTTKSILTPITNVTKEELLSPNPPKSFLTARAQGKILIR